MLISSLTSGMTFGQDPLKPWFGKPDDPMIVLQPIWMISLAITMLIAYIMLKQILTPSITVCLDRINPWFFWTEFMKSYLTGEVTVIWMGVVCAQLVLGWGWGDHAMTSHYCCSSGILYLYVPLSLKWMSSAAQSFRQHLSCQVSSRKQPFIQMNFLFLEAGFMLLSCLVFLHCRDVLRSPCPRT